MKITKSIEGEKKVPIRLGYLSTEDTEAKITWWIREYEHKFLFWTWHTYDYGITRPWFKVDSAAEQKSNKLLNVRVDEIKARIDAKIREWKEDRIN